MTIHKTSIKNCVILLALLSPTTMNRSRAQHRRAISRNQFRPLSNRLNCRFQQNKPPGTLPGTHTKRLEEVERRGYTLLIVLTRQAQYRTSRYSIQSVTIPSRRPRSKRYGSGNMNLPCKTESQRGNPETRCTSASQLTETSVQTGNSSGNSEKWVS